MIDETTDPQDAVDRLNLDVAAHAGLGSCTIQRAIKWSVERVNDDRVTETDAPGAHGWALLQWARESDTNECELWKSLFSRLITNRSEVPSGARYFDDPNVSIAECARRISALVADDGDDTQGKAKASPVCEPSK